MVTHFSRSKYKREHSLPMIMTSQVKIYFGAVSAFKVRVMVNVRVKVRFRVQKDLGFDA